MSVIEPQGSPNKKINSLQTLDRALDLLEIMAKAQTPLTVIELSKLLKVNRTTIYAMINSLLEGGFIERDDFFPGRYVLGYKMFELGNMYVRRFPFIRNVHYYALPIIEKWSLCLRIYAYISGGYIILLAEENRRIIPLATNEGILLPAHATAAGKVLLGKLPPKDLHLELEMTELEAYTANTIFDKEALREAVEKAKQDGFAYDSEEYLLGFSCVSVPIADTAGNIIAALSLSGSPETFAKHREAILKDALIAARSIATF